MRILTRLILVLLLLVASPLKAKDSHKAVYVIVDGVPADIIEKVKTPALDSIITAGGYSRSITGGEKGGPTETPTISAVCYNNILTSTWANKHNVWDNDIKAPNYNYPSIFKVVKSCKPQLKTGLFSGWEECLTKLVGANKVETGMLKVDYFFNSSDKDTVNYPLKDSMRIFNLDQDVTDEACKCIKEDGPDVTWIYLWFMDEVGHRYGTGAEFEKYLRMVDRQISQIWNAVKEREKSTGEQWLTIITTDHGRTEDNEGRNHGGQTERERTTWIAMDRPGNDYFKSEDPVSNTDIIPTICNFINLDVPISIVSQWEGVPFIGKNDFSDFKATKEGNIIKFTWKSYSKGDATIRVSITDHTKTGNLEGKDKWIVVGKPDLTEGYCEWDSNKLKSDFYKFYMESKYTAEGAWPSGK